MKILPALVVLCKIFSISCHQEARTWGFDGDMQREDKFRSGESQTKCMCPVNANTTLTYFQHCGRELSPASECAPETIYRCVNNRKFAIQTTSKCANYGEKCVPHITKPDGQQCAECLLHTYKKCSKEITP